MPEDLDAIEQKMKELAAAGSGLRAPDVAARGGEGVLRRARRAAEGAADRREDRRARREVSCYTIKDKDTFVDFCVGPHVPSTGRLKAFKLLNTSNAYWKGDARNQPMQRVYGTAFFSEKELKAHLTQIEEAKKRDHRKLGRELGLFTFHPVGAGRGVLAGQGHDALQHARELHARRAVPGRLRRGEDAAHLQQGAVGDVRPLVALPRRTCSSSSREGETDEREGDELPRPLSCSSRSEVRSYRDLPLRFHEQTPLHRNEASGVLSGLTRVRQFSQDDAHCFVTQEQIGDEVERLLGLVQRVYGDFGLPFTAKLSTRPAEFLGEVATWDSRRGAAARRRSSAPAMAYTINERRRRVLRAEDRLRRHRRDRPEVAVRDDPARLPCMPERFDLKYIGADNAEHRPVVIHRAIFGSFERFIAILIEHYAGRVSAVAGAVQAVVLPIADRHLDYAASVRDRLQAAGLRADLDERQEKIGYKIREAQLQKVPYMLVVGDREAAEGTVSVRSAHGRRPGRAAASADFIDDGAATKSRARSRQASDAQARTRGL